MITFVSYASVDPVVISEELINTAINEQITPEIAEIAKKEGIDPEEVKAIRLDYKNILKINNLWSLKNLTKLQLDNNIIEKIENINFLVNLTWLDLSFNNITVIEGLNELVNLTDLSLFNNRISKIENMDELTKLTVFSIGNNNLSSLENILYLTRFENLRVLNAAGNKICNDKNYKAYILANLKNLKYLDYRLINQEEVEKSRAIYLDDLIALEEEEKITKSKKEKLEQRRKLEQLFEEAHIKNIDMLFQDMFEQDPDFHKLNILAPEKIQDLNEDYRAKFEIIIIEMKDFILKKHSEVQEEKELITKAIEDAKAETDSKGIKLVNDLEHRKKAFIRTVSNMRDVKEIDEAVKAMKFDVDETSNELMALEMTIVEQFEEILREYEKNLQELFNSMLECGQTNMARIRELENNYFERYTECIMSAYDRIHKSDMDSIENDDLRELISDKEIILNSLNATHDFHLLKFDQQEDGLSSGCNKELEDEIQRTHNEETQRNRKRVIEIITYVERLYYEIDQAEDNIF
ncbi:outer arm dynein light chain 1 [Piromyces finnis]|uniref:Dynein regulatory complex subunit 3 n=1 Tax=Piromyces finnis TaxID=1754191 RepID=A0A1Y1UJ40_9FUNG|nr:outer arm dynein light chain 1 [Piromyces finnis]ORX49976.1 outer arm dynein light chain 1 [Piromyces finnis]|eukprot:ORX37504.1 outer arm dynein light chain 1 [Piromyces finnis]